MPTVLPDLALANIEPIVQSLIAATGHFSLDARQRLEELYARMRREARAARYPVQRGLAVARFLAAIDELAEVHAVVGEAIERTRGVLRRGTRPLPSDVLEQLPPSLADGAMSVQALAVPAGDAPPLSESTAFESLLGPASTPDGAHGSAPEAFQTREIQPHPPRDTAELPHTSQPVQDGAAPVEQPLERAVPTRSLTRYPSLEYPRVVALGARTSLLVVLEAQQREAVSVAVLIADTAPEPPVLEVVLRARAFDVEHSNTQLLEVARDGDADVRFVLVPREAGEHELRVDFYQHGRRIGTARRDVLVVEHTVFDVPVEREQLEAIEIGSSASVAPDLELCVEADRNDPQLLYFSLHSTVETVDLHHARAGTIRLAGSPLQKMQQVYDRLSRFAGQAPSGEVERLEQRAELERIGRNLWDELVSDELKASYWHFKDHVRTLLITSDEPWIPWEIVKPYRWDEQNRLVDEPFLCEKFLVGRWLSGPGPADRVPMRQLRPVAPTVSNLASVEHELTFLRAINTLHRGIAADEPFSERGAVIELFTNGSFNVLHIAAHGGFNALQPDDSRIMLDGGELRPADIFGRFGGQRPRPLVFINACHAARLEHAFTGLGGWADRLVRGAKVGAFVGAAWEVDDRLALLFAQAFYQALLRDGKTLGESFLLARRSIRDADPSNSSWLAYVLYADPGAHAALVANGVI